MLSFRVDDSVAAELDVVTREDGVSRSAVLAGALKAALYRRACERDARVYDEMPFTDDETVHPGARAWARGDDDASW